VVRDPADSTEEKQRVPDPGTPVRGGVPEYRKRRRSKCPGHGDGGCRGIAGYYNTGLGNTYPPAIPKHADHFTSDDRTWAEELASLLDQFNSGYIGPGPCVCPCWTPENLSNLTASSCVESTDNEFISVETVQNFTLSTSDSESPECNVVDHNKILGLHWPSSMRNFLIAETVLRS